MKDKGRLREIFRGRRHLPGIAGAASAAICSVLDSFEPLKGAEAFASFHPVRGEPDIRPFLEKSLASGKKIFFPRYSNADGAYRMAEASVELASFAKGRFAIPEPPSDAPEASHRDLKGIPWLVPGVAFDRSGSRLGHGHGFYDRLLESADGIKIGICFESQISGRLPSEKHDGRMDFIITEAGLHKCTKGVYRHVQ